MKKPILVIMAAGLGSRFGGLKQIEPIDKEGNIILDYSIYDAKMAGIEEVVCVIKRENLDIFKEKIGDKLEGKVKVHYAFQDMVLPEPFEVPEGREKPFGTAHAVMAAKEYINGPFIVINADDYYGREAFVKMYEFLTSNTDETEHAMVAYDVDKTLADTGFVSRGICGIDENSYLREITERTKVKSIDGIASYTDDEMIYNAFSPNTKVSMNFWGFKESMLHEFETYFPVFLEENLKKNPLKCEYYITIVPDILIKDNKAKIRVLDTNDTWYGITYPEDKPKVLKAFQNMKDDDVYPKKLWA